MVGCVGKSFQALYPVYRSARRSQIGMLSVAKFSRPSRLCDRSRNQMNRALKVYACKMGIYIHNFFLRLKLPVL